MKRLLLFLPLLAIAATYKSVTVDTNGVLYWPTNIFVVNSNLLNLAVAASSGTAQTNISYIAVTNAPWVTTNYVDTISNELYAIVIGQIPSTNGFVDGTITNGLATTNWVGLNYYPLSNPSNYVDATVTNGLLNNVETLTNKIYATNIVSGGQLPTGTVAANSMISGLALGNDGSNRIWTNSLPGVSVSSATSATKDASGNTITSTYAALAATNVFTASSNLFSGSVGIKKSPSAGLDLDVAGSATFGSTVSAPLFSTGPFRASSANYIGWLSQTKLLSSGDGSISITSNTVSVGTASGLTANWPTFTVITPTNAPTLSLNCMFQAGSGVSGSYGCLTMSTGSVSVATSASTNIFNAYNYSKTFGSIGVVSNSTFIVTNAGDYRISFGCSMLGGNGDTVKTLIFTNSVHCGIISFEKTMQNPAIAETGFKEFVVTLPASCLVSAYIANGAANATTIQNLCVNIKGAN